MTGAVETDPILDRRFADLDAAALHAILRLRIDVFVVEQECAYRDIDGRDDEPGTRHLWIADPDGPVAYLRVLDDGDVRRLGRVATRPEARGRGLAGRLVDHAVETTEGPWVLDAQAHLADWYGARGFVVSGAEFEEDGIVHVPMIRR